MTYRELFKSIECSNAWDQDVTVYNPQIDEYFGDNSHTTANGLDVLDDGQIFIVIGTGA